MEDAFCCGAGGDDGRTGASLKAGEHALQLG